MFELQPITRDVVNLILHQLLQAQVQIKISIQCYKSCMNLIYPQDLGEANLSSNILMEEKRVGKI